VALEAGRLGPWTWDVAAGRVTWSPALERMHGLEPGTFDGSFEAYQRDIHPDDRARVLAAIEATLAGAVHHLEYRIVRPDGEVRHLEANGQLIRDAAGAPARLVGVCTDVTERRLAEAERERLLSEAEAGRARLALLNRISRDLAESLDYETTLHRVVRLAIPTVGDFGFFDLVEGTEVRRIAHAHADPARQAILDGSRWVRSERTDMNLCALSSGSTGLHPDIGEAWLRDVAVNDGHYGVMDTLAFHSMLTVPLRHGGELLGAMTLFMSRGGRRHTSSDAELAEELANRASSAIVHARLYRAAEAASRAKDDFLALVGHELRTPLTVILGYTQSIQAGRVPPERLARAMEAIDRNARIQARLVEELLDLTRLVRGDLAIAREPVALSRLAAEVVAELQEKAAHKDQHLGATLADGIVVAGDAERLRQVLAQLVANALEFTPRGGRVEVSLQADDGAVALAVTDSGEGIAAAFLPSLFSPFRQADASIRRQHGGLGIGLAIARAIVEAHGGSIGAHSDGPGRGATFTVRLPRA
jgi:PAS domain S-box-containing protein